jgi:hypothetical protein
MSKDETIRVIMFQEGEKCWVAQGLERDICVQAETLKDLYGRFEVAVRLEGDEPGGLDRIGKAPDYFFELWDGKAGGYTPDTDGNPSFQFGIAA